jgi:acyl-CoA thioester hydrolase
MMNTMGKVIFEQTIHTFQIDINRHVSNIVYLQWMEIGRTRLLEAIGIPIETMQERGYLAILAETWIQHRGALFFPDVARIEVWVSELTRVSAWMDFHISSGRTGQLAARARQRGVFVSAETNRPYRISAEDRQAFGKVLVPEQA